LDELAPSRGSLLRGCNWFSRRGCHRGSRVVSKQKSSEFTGIQFNALRTRMRRCKPADFAEDCARNSRYSGTLKKPPDANCGSQPLRPASRPGATLCSSPWAWGRGGGATETNSPDPAPSKPEKQSLSGGTEFGDRS
jgi:hypothetical protein